MNRSLLVFAVLCGAPSWADAPQQYEVRRVKPLIVSGAAVLGGFEVVNVLLAVSGHDPLLAIPVAGPIYGGINIFRMIASRDCAHSNGYFGADGCNFGSVIMGVFAVGAIADGVLQAVGLASLITGIAWRRQVPIEPAIVPVEGGAAVTLGGAF